MRNLNNCVYYLHERIGLDSDFLYSIVWDSQLTGVQIIYMLAADMHGLIRLDYGGCTTHSDGPNGWKEIIESMP